MRKSGLHFELDNGYGIFLGRTMCDGSACRSHGVCRHPISLPPSTYALHRSRISDSVRSLYKLVRKALMICMTEARCVERLHWLRHPGSIVDYSNVAARCSIVHWVAGRAGGGASAIYVHHHLLCRLPHGWKMNCSDVQQQTICASDW